MGLSFNDLSKTLRRNEDNKIIDLVDSMTGILIILSPFAFGPLAAGAYSLLEVKGDLIKHWRRAVAEVSQADAGLLGNRIDVLEAVYTLSCFAAFFEAIDKSVAKIKKELKLPDGSRLTLSERAMEQVSRREKLSDSTSDRESATTSYVFNLPHPTSTLQSDAESLSTLYTQMTQGYKAYIEGLSAWEGASETAKDHINALISGLTDRAVREYKGQYLALCREFNEFYIWANLTEHELTRRQVRSATAEIQTLIAQKLNLIDKIDLGLESVFKICVALGASRPESAAIAGLNRYYQARVDSPVIYDQTTEPSSLVYPTKRYIFIPQAFRSIRRKTTAQSLENELVWADRSIQNDLGPFLLQLFSSPHCLEAPIVILGHPGSGKSLLTDMLAAQLTASRYQAIRIELRDINADSDIQTQIEAQIRRDTGWNTSWPEFAMACGNTPPIVIFDGYDELLQATGRAFSTYMMKVESFQRRELMQDRPLRTIISSRITLIDKAEIPIGSTVIRLEDFDEGRRQTWASVWNSTNAHYFEARQLHPFVPPTSQTLEPMARQPLLLLMLALYDSEQNDLFDSENLDQTRLYNSLLRRFIDREHRKGELGSNYAVLSESARESLIDADMRRLGVTAVGMFNRRALHIYKADLEKDLSFFDIRRAGGSDVAGFHLTEAELLLGSFFFVHESSAQVGLELVDGATPASAFEFLHNTFGEFLVADFILATLIREASTIVRLRAGGSLLADTLSRKFDDPDGLDLNLLAACMFAPIHTRPVIVEMLAEWSVHFSTPEGFSASSCSNEIGEIVQSAAARVLNGGALPTMSSEAYRHPFPNVGTLSHCAILTLNLVVIRCALESRFEFGTKSALDGRGEISWQRLGNLWRAGIAPSDLASLGSIVETRQTREGVMVSLRSGVPSEGLLQSRRRTANALGDDFLEGLVGLVATDASPIAAPEFDDLMNLRAMKQDPLISVLRQKQLKRQISSEGLDYHEAYRLRNFPTLSATYLRDRIDHSIDMRRSTPVLEFNLGTLLDLPAEIAVDYVRSCRASYMDHNEDFTPSLLSRLVRTRALAAADLVLDFAQATRSGRIRNIDTRRGKHPGKAILEFIEAGADGLEIASEIAIEAIAFRGFAPPLDQYVDRLMGASISTDSLLSRSSESFRSVLAHSQEAGRIDWIERLYDDLQPGRGGFELVRRMRVYRVAAIVESISRREPANDLAPQVGVLDVALAFPTCDYPEETFRLIVHILRRWPSWRQFSSLREVALRLNLNPNAFSEFLSPSLLNYIREVEPLDE